MHTYIHMSKCHARCDLGSKRSQGNVINWVYILHGCRLQHDTLKRRLAERESQGLEREFETRKLKSNVQRLQRPLDADRESIDAYLASHQRYLTLALANYRRCASDHCAVLASALCVSLSASHKGHQRFRMCSQLEPI